MRSAHFLLCMIASVMGFDLRQPPTSTSEDFFNFFKYGNLHEFHVKGFPEFRPQESAEHHRTPQPYVQTTFSSNPYAFMPSHQRNMMEYHQKQAAVQELINREAQQQSAIMAENYLEQFKQEENCFHQSYCEAAMMSKEDNLDAGEAIRVMRIMLDVVGQQNAHRFPNVRQLVAAWNVGQMTKDVSLCKSLFPCKSDNTDMSVEMGRSLSCKASGKLCPGISISCGICAFMSVESCSVVCPVAAIYCGTAGYACSPPPPAPAVEEPEELATEAPPVTEAPTHAEEPVANVPADTTPPFDERVPK